MRGTKGAVTAFRKVDNAERSVSLADAWAKNGVVGVARRVALGLTSFTGRMGALIFRRAPVELDPVCKPAVAERAVAKTEKKRKLVDGEHDRLIEEAGSRLSESTKPIVVGPWLSEVGFEVLYWAPFVNWFVSRYRIDPARIRVLSRGGVKAWYGQAGRSYIDIFDRFEPSEFVALNNRRISSGAQKHMTVGDVDREIVAGSLGEQAAESHELLHPSLMYTAFKAYWSREWSPRQVKRYSTYEPMTAPPAPTGVAPSEPYTVAKFYFSDTFPKTEANERFIIDILSREASRNPVLLFRNKTTFDDHSDALTGLPDNVFVYEPANPKTNLGDQTGLIGGARRFIGTYGGFSYIAPFLGVPSLSFYTNIERLVPVHVDMAMRIFRELRTGQFDKNAQSGAKGAAPNAIFNVVDAGNWV